MVYLAEAHSQNMLSSNSVPLSYPTSLIHESTSMQGLKNIANTLSTLEVGSIGEENLPDFEDQSDTTKGLVPSVIPNGVVAGMEASSYPGAFLTAESRMDLDAPLTSINHEEDMDAEDQPSTLTHSLEMVMEESELDTENNLIRNTQFNDNKIQNEASFERNQLRISVPISVAVPKGHHDELQEFNEDNTLSLETPRDVLASVPGSPDHLFPDPLEEIHSIAGEDKPYQEASAYPLMNDRALLQSEHESEIEHPERDADDEFEANLSFFLDGAEYGLFNPQHERPLLCDVHDIDHYFYDQSVNDFIRRIKQTFKLSQVEVALSFDNFDGLTIHEETEIAIDNSLLTFWNLYTALNPETDAPMTITLLRRGVSAKWKLDQLIQQARVLIEEQESSSEEVEGESEQGEFVEEPTDSDVYSAVDACEELPQASTEAGSVPTAPVFVQAPSSPRRHSSVAAFQAGLIDETEAWDAVEISEDLVNASNAVRSQSIPLEDATIVEHTQGTVCSPSPRSGYSKPSGGSPIPMVSSTKGVEESDNVKSPVAPMLEVEGFTAQFTVDRTTEDPFSLKRSCSTEGESSPKKLRFSEEPASSPKESF